MDQMEDGRVLVLHPDANGDDKYTFVVTIKPSPPTRRRTFQPKTPPPPSGEEKNFSDALQELIEQITAPAERELEEQLRPRPEKRSPLSWNNNIQGWSEGKGSAFTAVSCNKTKWRTPVGRPNERRACWDRNVKGNEFEVGASSAEFHEKFRRLENEKESLSLQVSVLSDQVEAQNEKIRDLEANLQQEKGKANKMEEMLQQEMKLRSSVENQKLQVMSEMSKLKLSISQMESEKFELEKKIFKAENEIEKLQRSIDHSALLSQRGRKTPTSDANCDVEKMKKALESVMAANDEKDRKIDELRAATLRYKRIQEKMLDSQRYGNNRYDDVVDSPNYYTNKVVTTESAKLVDKPPPAPRGISTSTPQHSKIDANPPQVSPIVSTGRRSMSPQRMRNQGMASSLGSEESVTTQPESRQTFRPPISHYGTVPRNYAPALQAANEGSTTTLPNIPHVKSFGKEFVMSERASSRSTSAPNLAQTEVVNEEEENTNAVPELSKNKGSKGLKKFLGKLKRSNSQSIDGSDSNEFRRGGLRATAGSRLGWSQNIAPKELLDVPFSRWDTEKVMAWVHELGLSSYISDVKRWVRNGDQLLNATPDDLEKELGIKNNLHRKKLTLSLQAKGSEDEDIFVGLDYHWVTRWLDDVGLPQYKDSFGDGRVDGRMLHYFTLEDLCHVHVTNLLHALSLKQGIYILRQHKFNPLCLKRRSAPDESSTPVASEVALWTNHRVMEWLRSVDLSEYAPNLRGSGVHGALMIFEDRFNAELLATLLSIPPTKTLLRRHLSMHFKALVGPQVMQSKREREMAAGYVALTPSVKVKVPKKSQFSLRKKNKSELEEYLCPMDGETNSSLAGSPTGEAGSPTFRNSSPVSRGTLKGSPRMSTDGRQ